MGPSHRQQLSTEEILAGRDNEEEAVSGRGAICQLLSRSSQDSRKGNEEERTFVPKAQQRSLRTFSKEVSLCSLARECWEDRSLPIWVARFVTGVRSWLLG